MRRPDSGSVAYCAANPYDMNCARVRSLYAGYGAELAVPVEVTLNEKDAPLAASTTAIVSRSLREKLSVIVLPFGVVNMY